MLFSSWFITGCGTDRLDNSTKAEGENTANTISGSLVSGNGTANSNTTSAPYNRKSRIADVMADLVFGSYGRLLFPVQRGYWSGETLEKLRLTYYNYIDSDETVTIVNYLHNQADNGKPYFTTSILTRKVARPTEGRHRIVLLPWQPWSTLCSVQCRRSLCLCGSDARQFPSCLRTLEEGLQCFCLDLPTWGADCLRGLGTRHQFYFAHKDELGVDTDCYSLWGGSAGGRMAAWVSGYGTAAFGGDNLPKAGTAVIQYTRLTDYSRDDVPTYACVGSSDGIASWRTMKARLDGLASLGIPTEFHVYEGLPHGFGLGAGTVAEGWFDDAVKFWEKQMKDNGTTEIKPITE